MARTGSTRPRRPRAAVSWSTTSPTYPNTWPGGGGRLPGETGKLLWMRLGERDEVDLARNEKGLYLGRREQNPWGGQPSEQAHQVETIRSRYPYVELRDVTPHLDRLRMIKTPREIEILRRAGKVSADGIAAAIAATEAGAWEYELEAAAKHVFLQHGAEMEAYPAIVGSGPNGLIWHWIKNDRQLEDGDLVVMDYGASFAYLTMDITRTWPVNGEFDEVQERAYRAVLEAQKAIIAAILPGATRAETTEICRAIYDRWGFEDKPAHGAGHFVGLSVHGRRRRRPSLRTRHGDRRRADHRDPRAQHPHPHRGHGARHRRRAGDPERCRTEGGRRPASLGRVVELGCPQRED